MVVVDVVGLQGGWNAGEIIPSPTKIRPRNRCSDTNLLRTDVGNRGIGVWGTAAKHRLGTRRVLL